MNQQIDFECVMFFLRYKKYHAAWESSLRKFEHKLEDLMDERVGSEIRVRLEKELM